MKAKKIFEFKENIQNLGNIFLNKLNDFINSSKRNEWIFSSGIRMYVRKSKRYYKKEFIDCLDLASAETDEYGTGLFTYILEQILKKYPNKNIFAESILNDRLYTFLLKYGFEPFGESNLIKLKNSNLSENIHFERGIDPKLTMEIGLINKIKKRFKELQLKKGVGSIDFFKDSKENFIRILYYGNENFTNLVNETIGTEFFSDIYSKGSKGFRSIMKLIIKKEYNNLFNSIFDNKGFIKEHLSFERNKSPFDSLKIGLKYKRHYKTFEEAAKVLLDNIKELSEGEWDTIEEFKKSWQEKNPLRFLKEYLEGFNGKYNPLFIEEDGYNFSNTSTKIGFLKSFRDALRSILYKDI